MTYASIPCLPWSLSTLALVGILNVVAVQRSCTLYHEDHTQALAWLVNSFPFYSCSSTFFGC
jgi:hypothetical protein